MTMPDVFNDHDMMTDDLLTDYFSRDNIEFILSNSVCNIYSEGEQLFRPGGQLTDIQIIISGSARLLCSDGSGVHCLEKLQRGGLVGLQSLILSQSCEDIISSSPVQTISIPAKIVMDLWQTDSYFQHFVSSSPFTMEVFNTFSCFFSDLPRRPSSLVHFIQSLSQSIHSVDPESLIASVHDDPLLLILVSYSTNSKFECGQVIELNSTLSDMSYPSSLRLLKIPRSVLNSYTEAVPDTVKFSEYAKSIPGNRGDSADFFPNPSPLKSVPLRKASQPCHILASALLCLSDLSDFKFTYEQIFSSLLSSYSLSSTFNPHDIGRFAQDLGLQVSYFTVEPSLVVSLRLPVLIDWNSSYAVIVSIDSDNVLIASPRDGYVELALDDLGVHFPSKLTGFVFSSTPVTKTARFGFRWIVSFLEKYKSVFILVLVSSFFAQLLTIANPLLIQVIIDKVISSRSVDMLPVIVMTIGLASLLSSLIRGFRSVLLAQTTNRIDSAISIVIVDHLLRLPLQYFDKRPVGDLSTRVNELEKIREFMTGQSLTLLIDVLFVFVYIFIMCFYSIPLTIASLSVIPVQIILYLVGSSFYRQRLSEAASLHGSSQSYFIELLSGIQTVKTQAVELLSRWKWQKVYGKYLSKMLAKSSIAIFINETSSFLQGLSQLIVITYGAILVVQGSLSLGALIAFRIIAGNATQPMLRMTSILQSIQEIKVSIRRLADIVDTPEEYVDGTAPSLPVLSGSVQFDNVSFAFPGSSDLALRNISLDITPGTFVAVVGQSGSGKSTLTKLLSRLYLADKGTISLDDYDINKVSLPSLREQIGVVPQDPLLFRGSIRENIALADPRADLSEIEEAARLACAHDFIVDLPKGYDTLVGERGGALSGGQRQRVTLARTLLKKPTLLILDEATSALDYITELNVTRNLLSHLKGSTVFYVTHRLASIQKADLILVMHDGNIEEAGCHDQLLDLRGRYYSLFTQQQSGDIT